MTGRWALPEETPDLQALWERVFGDGAEITGVFFRLFPPERHTRVILAESSVAAMASWIPVMLGDLPGAYVYAVATAPEYRGRGLAHALLREMEQALADGGLAFAALCPAEASLYDFYAAQGYEAVFSCSRFPAEPAGAPMDLTALDAAQYRAKREALLAESFLRWDETALKYLEQTGTRFYAFPGGCAAVSAAQDARVPELIADRPHEAAAGLCAALDLTGAEVFTPGIEAPRGMLKSLTIGQKIPRAYLGFAFD